MRVALLDDHQGVALSMADWSRLPPGWEVTAFRDRVTGSEAIVARLQPFDAVMVMRARTPLRRDVLEQLPSLQLLVNAGTRAPGIDLTAATDLGILVCGTPTRGNGPTQQAWALLLGLARHVVAEDQAVRAGAWGTTVGTDLSGRVMGLLGLGTIGGQMARIAAAFGMRVIAWSANLTADRAAEHGAELVTKRELFRQADVLSVHLRLGDRTRGIVGAGELALMKPTALLVNTARGALVDEDALVAALTEGRIAGAGLDVFAVEPLPADHPLLSLPNTLLSPHAGYVTDVRYAGYYEGAVACIRAFADGTPQRVLNPEVLGSPALRSPPGRPGGGTPSRP